MAVRTEPKAFPNAIGAGANTLGGSGGKVCHVNTLTWNTGSFTYDAATDTYSGGFYDVFFRLDIPSRIIVFDVAGTITVPNYTELNFDTKSNKSNITVAGQTAPGKIVFSTDYFYINNLSDVIWRYCSFYSRGTTNSDVLWWNTGGGTNPASVVENVIFSNCSFFYGGDECLSIAGSSGGGNITNVTVQDTLMAASSKGSIIGSYVGTSDATTARVAYIDTNYRFPNMLGYGTSRQDAYNIFVENYGDRLIRTTGSGDFNVLNGYIQPNRVNYGRHRVQYNSSAPPSIHSSGHILVGVQDTPTTPDFNLWSVFAGSTLPEYSAMPEDAKVNTPMTLVGVADTVYNASDVKTNVLPFVGNNKRLAADGSVIQDSYELDDFYIDLGVNQVSTTSTYRYPSTQYPNPTSGTPYADTNKDGIPDAWDTANMGGAAYNDLAPSGYTWLEEFLNQVDVTAVGAIPVITLIGNSVINHVQGTVYTDAGATASDTEDGNITGSIVVGGDTVDINTVGTYIITYNVQDSDLNNALQVTRTVNVVPSSSQILPYNNNRRLKIGSNPIKVYLGPNKI